MCGLISSLLLKKNLYDPIFKMVGDIGGAFGSIYLKLCRKALDKKSPPLSRDGRAASKLMVAQVFNLCIGGVLLSPGGPGFQPVNPLRIIGVAGLNYRVRDGIGCGPAGDMDFQAQFQNLRYALLRGSMEKM